LPDLTRFTWRSLLPTLTGAVGRKTSGPPFMVATGLVLLAQSAFLAAAARFDVRDPVAYAMEATSPGTVVLPMMTPGLLMRGRLQLAYDILVAPTLEEAAKRWCPGMRLVIPLIEVIAVVARLGMPGLVAQLPVVVMHGIAGELRLVDGILVHAAWNAFISYSTGMLSTFVL